MLDEFLNGAGRLLSASAYEGRVQAFVVDGGPVVEALRRAHDTEPAVTAALGRTALAALLFAARLKADDHVVTVRLDGDGPAGTLLATATGAGTVRGLAGRPRPGIEQVNADGKLNVAGAVGRTGTMSVVSDMGLGRPYGSTVELVSGEVGEDIAHYLARSEQIPSAVGVGVFVAADGTVESAGGYLVQLVGGLEDALVAELEQRLRALPHPTVMLRNGEQPEQILSRMFGDGWVGREWREVRFHCPCSRDRAERALMLLGEEVLVELLEEANETGSTELCCEFCGDDFQFGPDDLETLIADVRASRTGGG